MSLFTVDTSKCKKDFICTAVCPLGIIEKADDGPAPAGDAEKL